MQKFAQEQNADLKMKNVVETVPQAATIKDVVQKENVIIESSPKVDEILKETASEIILDANGKRNESMMS